MLALAGQGGPGCSEDGSSAASRSAGCAEAAKAGIFKDQDCWLTGAHPVLGMPYWQGQGRVTKPSGKEPLIEDGIKDVRMDMRVGW